MKVTGWTWYDNPDYTVPDIRKWIPDGYDHGEVKELIADEIRNHGYKFTGDYHQYGEYGVPIIDDKWLYQTSQRAWGHMMVRAYPEEIDNTDGYGYCLWAWTAPEPMHVPDPKDYKED